MSPNTKPRSPRLGPRERQRDIVDHQRPEGCSIRRGCVTTPTLLDDQLVQMIDDIQDGFPGNGYRRVTLELRRRGATRQPQARGAGDKGRRPRREAASALRAHHRQRP